MTLYINDIDPSTIGALLDSKASLRVTPAKRGGNISVPLLDGAIFLPEKRYEESDLTVNFLIEPRDPVTNSYLGVTGLSEGWMEKNVAAFLRLIGTDTLTLKHARQDGTNRVCTCEVVDVVDFTQISVKPRWNKVAVHFKVVGAFWESDSYTAISAFSLGTGGTRYLTELQDAEARMSNMVITFGPSTNPQISQGATGIYVRYNGVIAAGRVLTINTQTGQLGTTGGTAWTPDEGSLVHSGDARLFSLRPEKITVSNTTGSPQITITHTGGGTMQTTLSVLKKYMTG